MFVVVSYDIVDTKRRNTVMKSLKGVGFHVQKSVFECYMDKKNIDKLVKRLTGYIDLEEDSIRIYTMPDHLSENTTIVGTGELSKNSRLILF